MVGPNVIGEANPRPTLQQIRDMEIGDPVNLVNVSGDETSGMAVLVAHRLGIMVVPVKIIEKTRFGALAELVGKAMSMLSYDA